MVDAAETFFRRVKALGAHYFEDPPKPRRVIAGLGELAAELGLLAEVESGLLAPDPLKPEGPILQPLDHELVTRRGPAPGAKNLQACAAGSHDWGPYDPNIGGHECLACGTVYTRRA